MTASDAGSGIHGQGYSFDGGKTWQEDSFKIFDELTLNFQEDTIVVRDGFGNRAYYETTLIASALPCDCTLPGGEPVPHGDTIDAYTVKRAPCEKTCSDLAISMKRTCSNGVLSGGQLFRYISCDPAICENCILPWGGYISHRADVKAYKNSEISCEDDCENHAITRFCFDGKLDGDPLYSKETCKKKGCSCDFPWGGGPVGDGSEITAYKSRSVTCLNSCDTEKIQRTCENGNFSGDDVYNLPSCSLDSCRKCDVPGGTIDHGQTIELATASKAECGTLCSAITVTKTCEDGTLTGPGGPEYRFFCQEATNCTCDLPWGNGDTINHGETISAFSIEVGSSCGISCADRTVELSCDTGTIIGNTGNIYQYATCDDTDCCPTPWGDGQNIPHGNSVLAYTNQEVACNASCPAPELRVCDDGTLTGNAAYSEQNCSKADCIDCDLPGGGGDKLTDGYEVQYYSAASVTCGYSCADVSSTLKCEKGILTGNESGTFNLNSCVEEACDTGGGVSSSLCVCIR